MKLLIEGENARQKESPTPEEPVRQMRVYIGE